MQLKRLLKLRGYRFAITALALAALVPASLVPAKEAPAPSGTLPRVRQTGTLKLGYYDNARPFTYQDESGKPAGYVIALCQGIANDVKKELGLPSLAVQFVPVTMVDRFDAVKQGKVDLLCGPSVETLDRRKEISYSIPIFPGGLGALLRADAPAQILAALEGREPPYRPQWRASIALALHKRTFSAVNGTTSLSWLARKRDEFKIDAQIVPVASDAEGVERVLNRSLDVLFEERSVLLDAKKRNPAGEDLMVLDRLFTFEPLGLALARGDEDFRLLVDRSLSNLSRSGEMQSLYRKFFGELDLPTLMFFQMRAVPE